MMAETNLTKDGAQTNAFEDFRCSPFLAGGLPPQSIHFSATVYIILSITIFLGNSLILVALHKESSLHPPSKLLYRCLATTDLLVGIFSQSMVATYFMSLANDNWSLSIRKRRHLHNKLHILRSVFIYNNVARCCVEILRACGRALRNKGLSDGDRPGAVDRIYLSFQIHVTSGENKTTVY